MQTTSTPLQEPRGVHGSVRFLSKKVTKPNFFLKKTETGSNRPVLVRFFREKTGSNRFFRFGSVLARFDSVLARLARFFPIWLGFFGLARFFSGFFSVRFGSVFPVPGLKNRTGRFFQNFNRFFFTVRFFWLFFFQFSRFNQFFCFFLTPKLK